MKTALADPIAEALPASLETAVRQIRGRLTELCASIDADPTAPRQAARQLGINRNLTWKVSKIVNAPDAMTLVQHLPGRAGLEILLEACEQAGAPAAVVDAARSAVGTFDELVEAYAGDRETLVLMLNSMNVCDRARPLGHESARKKSFQGNSAIWGVQARVRFLTHFIAPNRDEPDLLDNAVVSGLLDLRRLRPNADWPLFRIATSDDDGTPIETTEEPIDPKSSAGLPLMREYCSKPIPQIREVQLGTHTEYELVSGPLGRSGAATCVIGHCARACVSKYRDATNEFGELRTKLVTPVEYQISDLLLHKDMGMTTPPRPYLYSLLTTSVPYPQFGRDRHLLQMSTELQELGSNPPVVATPHIAGYSRIVESTYDRLGWSAQDFTGYRFVMRYPPIPTLLVLRYDLPERGA